MIASIIVTVIIAVYLFIVKPDKDLTDKAKTRAAELAKFFGDVHIECYQIDGGKEQDIYALYVLFEGKRHSDPRYRYVIIEKVYKADSKREKKRKLEYVNRVLNALPYGQVPLYTSAYYADTFFERREKGILMQIEDDFEKNWQENKHKYKKFIKDYEM